MYRVTTCFIFTLLLCWPSAYRLLLPHSLGTLTYYAIAYMIPLVAGIIILLAGRNNMKRILLLLAIVMLLVFSVIFAKGTGLGWSTLLYGVKFYLTPLMLLAIGAYFGKRLTSDQILRLLAVVIIGHLIFSLMFYYDVIGNPVYAGGEEFSENWTSTLGVFKAFIGLTLSKFDLAYQVGFIAVGLLLTGPVFISRRWLYWLTTLSAIATVMFTYNKTMYFIIAVTLLIKVYRHLRERARLVALGSVTVGLCAVSYFVTLFLRGELPLTEIALFLSPQTFWSRVGIWESVTSFTSANLYSGFGAGYMTQLDLTVDNQYLYTYLEMGLLGAAVYFGLITASFRHITAKAVDSVAMLVLLALIFLIGDMLNALALMYVVGLFLGLESSVNEIAIERKENPGAEPGIIPAIGGAV